MRIKYLILILVVIISISLIYADGEGEGSSGEGSTAVVGQSEGGSSEGTTAVITKKSNITKKKNTEPETEFKKLDRFLRSIFIVNNTDESKEYLGFYIGLTEADTNEEFKNILEEKGLIVTYSIGHIYLVFTPDNIEQKIDEVTNLPFVDWINKNAEKVIPINSIQKISIFIALNQSDNVSKTLKWTGRYVFSKSDSGYDKQKEYLNMYDKPGTLGEILEEKGAQLTNYEDDLKGYTANVTLGVIKELINLDFVTHIAKEKVFGVAGADASQIEATAEKISTKEKVPETEVNISEEKKIEEENKVIPLEQKEETKEKQHGSLFSRFLNLLKSLFGFR